MEHVKNMTALVSHSADKKRMDRAGVAALPRRTPSKAAAVNLPDTALKSLARNRKQHVSAVADMRHGPYPAHPALQLRNSDLIQDKISAEIHSCSPWSQMKLLHSEKKKTGH